MALELSEPERRQALTAPAVGGSIAGAQVIDVVRAFARYRGLALLIVGIVLASAILPGPNRAERAADDEAAQTATVRTDVAEAPIGEPVLSDAPTVLDDQPARFSTIDTSDRSSAPSPDVAAPRTQPSSGGTSAPAPSASSTTEPPRTTTTVPPTPLLIRASGWSTRTSGTPVASRGVPAGALPVGMMFGAEDKLSFVRLSGTATTLRLQLAAPEGQRTPQAAKIVACPITSDWQPAEAMSFNEDPEFDCKTSAAGQLQPDGSWSFDLSAFPDIAGDKGFALTPIRTGTLDDWQVSFRSRA